MPERAAADRFCAERRSEGRNAEGSFRAGALNSVDAHELSPLKDRTFDEVCEAAQAVKKGGTALMTPFADNRLAKGFLYAERIEIVTPKLTKNVCCAE